MLTGRNKDELFINALPYDLVPEAERPRGVIFLWSVIYGVRATYKSLHDKFQQYGREDLVFLLSKMVTVEAEISAQSGECTDTMQWFYDNNCSIPYNQVKCVLMQVVCKIFWISHVLVNICMKFLIILNIGIG